MINIASLFVTALTLHGGVSAPVPGEQDTPKISAPAAQAKKSPPNTSRVYKLGEVDVYQFKMVTAGPVQGTATGTLTEKVTKTYDNGDADVSETITDFKTESSLPFPEPSKEPTKLRLNSYGSIIGEMPTSPTTWGVFSIILPAADDLLSEKTWTTEKSMPGNTTVKSISKVVDAQSPLYELGVEGSLNAGQMNAGLKGDLVWDNKASRYNKGWFTISFVAPEGVPGGASGAMTMTMSFERLEKVTAPAK